MSPPAKHQALQPQGSGLVEGWYRYCPINNGAGAQLTTDTEYNASHLQANPLILVNTNDRTLDTGRFCVACWETMLKTGSLHVWCNTGYFALFYPRTGLSGHAEMSYHNLQKALQSKDSFKDSYFKCIFFRSALSCSHCHGNTRLEGCCCGKALKFVEMYLLPPAKGKKRVLID